MIVHLQILILLAVIANQVCSEIPDPYDDIDLSEYRNDEFVGLFIRYVGGEISYRASENKLSKIKVPDGKKPEDYVVKHKLLKFRGAGTLSSVFKISYKVKNVDKYVAIKIVLKEHEKVHQTWIDSMNAYLHNEYRHLNDLKEGVEDPVKLGFVELHRYIENGIIKPDPTKNGLFKKEERTDYRVSAIIMTLVNCDLFRYILMEASKSQWIFTFWKNNFFRNEVEHRRIFRQIVSSLHQLHLRGKLHNDLGIDNVFMLDGSVVLGDMGLMTDIKEMNALKKTEGAFDPKKVIYLRDEVPTGNKAILSWEAITIINYIRQIVDDFFSAGMTGWTMYFNSPFDTDEAHAAWKKNRKVGLELTKKLRERYHESDYALLKEYYKNMHGANIPTGFCDMLVEYHKYIAEAVRKKTDVVFTDLLEIIDRPHSPTGADAGKSAQTSGEDSVEPPASQTTTMGKKFCQFMGKQNP